MFSDVGIGAIRLEMFMILFGSALCMFFMIWSRRREDRAKQAKHV